jgi:hypothetical protein
MEQRAFYPAYPGNIDVPIEYTQFEKMMIHEMPDIMLTPTDLTQFVKVILYI